MCSPSVPLSLSLSCFLHLSLLSSPCFLHQESRDGGEEEAGRGGEEEEGGGGEEDPGGLLQIFVCFHPTAVCSGWRIKSVRFIRGSEICLFVDNSAETFYSDCHNMQLL